MTGRGGPPRRWRRRTPAPRAGPLRRAVRRAPSPARRRAKDRWPPRCGVPRGRTRRRRAGGRRRRAMSCDAHQQLGAPRRGLRGEPPDDEAEIADFAPEPGEEGNDRCDP